MKTQSYIKALGLTICACSMLISTSSCSSAVRGPQETTAAAGLEESGSPQTFSFPSEAEQLHTASADSPVLLRQGAQYNSLVPLANASPENDQRMIFSPEYPADGGNFAGLACACYTFQARGSEPLRRIRLDWQTAPDPDNIWLAVSNWDYRRWEFLAVSDSFEAVFSEDSAYLQDGDRLLVLVVVGGMEGASLASLRLGAVAPAASLSVSTYAGRPPLQVSLDASASSAGEGSITEFEWDYEGDGSFDQNSGTDAQVSHSYAASGSYQPRVRVTNSHGLSSVVQLADAIEVSNNFAVSFGLGGNDSVNDLTAAPDGSLFICGRLSDLAQGPVGGHSFAARVSSSGELEWIRTLEADADTAGQVVAADSDGNVYVAGTQAANGITPQRAFVQKWSADGSILWFRHIVGLEQISTNALVCSAGMLYVGGTAVVPARSYDLFVLCISGSGELVWCRSEGSAESEYAGDMQLLTSQLNPPHGLSVLGSRSGQDFKPIRIDLSLAGDVTDAKLLECGEPGEDIFGRGLLYYSSLFDDPEYYISCSYERADSSPDGALLFGIGTAGASRVGRRIEGTTSISCIAGPGGGELLACGNLSLLGQGQGWQAVFSTATLVPERELSIGGLQSTNLNAIVLLDGGLVAAGIAPSAAAAVTEFSFADTAASASWSDYTTSGMDNLIALSGAAGDVENPADILVYNQPAGQGDCYLRFGGDEN